MKIIGTGLVALMLLAPVAAVAAVPAPAGKAMATAAGQIASIDAAAKSLVVKVTAPGEEPQSLSLVMAEDSKIIRNGAAIGLGELKQGDKVTITYRQEDGKNLVVNIGVESKT
jgi:Cu/Ag efflux protein CusF